MKKIILIFTLLFIVIITIFMNYFFTKQKNIQEIKAYNNKFLMYVENEKGDKINVSGIDLTTLMNKAIDHNEQIGLKKQENGAYILNKTDSIEIMVQVEKNGDYFLMEAFAVLGMSNFTIEWGEDEFSCEKVEYHENGKISKMIFGIIK